jgi:hypothetical protein
LQFILVGEWSIIAIKLNILIMTEAENKNSFFTVGKFILRLLIYIIKVCLYLVWIIFISIFNLLIMFISKKDARFKTGFKDNPFLKF